MTFFNIKFPLRLIKSFYYYLKELIEFKIKIASKFYFSFIFIIKNT